MVTGENMYDTWVWVSKIIASCKDIYHINACERLIENYRKMYNDLLFFCKILPFFYLLLMDIIVLVKG